ncbi:uncharacterized protein ISCGN_023255 [Ixodes scapularis]
MAASLALRVALSPKKPLSGACRCRQWPLLLQACGLKLWKAPPDYGDVEFPEERRLRILEKTPQYPPGVSSPKMVKDLATIRGPELVHNKLLYNQYGIIDGQERPVAFASRRLHAAEQRYSQLDKEGLALLFGVQRFHQYLWGRQFEAVTDHKPLLGLLGPDKAVPVQASPRVVRWALTLAAYRYKLVYRPGKDLGPADALSRLPLPEVPAAVPEPADVFLLERAYPGVLTRTLHDQTPSWCRPCALCI